jgi:hypothetical protein
MRVGRVSDGRFAGIVVQRPCSIIAQSILGTSESFSARFGISKPGLVCSRKANPLLSAT